MRSILGRRDHRAALGADLVDRPAAAHRAGELDFADAGEADAVDLRGRPLKYRGLFIDADSHPHEFGTVGEQRNLAHLADWHAGEADVRALVEPADAMPEIDVEAFGLLVRETGKPDDEQQDARKERHGDRTDHDVVRAGFHQATTLCS
jgi:hypothetical protein